ncbi:MAG: two-component system sensor histidine kinase/response regulator [Shewanella sp.]|jgi:two-component system sensor histidine kinase/response regulator
MEYLFIGIIFVGLLISPIGLFLQLKRAVNQDVSIFST